MTYSIDESPGRLRIRIPAIKRDPEAAARAAARLAELPGIRVIVTAADRGLLTVTYLPDVICPSEILNALSRSGFLGGIRALPRARRSLAPHFGLRLVVSEKPVDGTEPLAPIFRLAEYAPERRTLPDLGAKALNYLLAAFGAMRKMPQSTSPLPDATY